MLANATLLVTTEDDGIIAEADAGEISLPPLGHASLAGAQRGLLINPLTSFRRYAAV